jgi:carbon monoxide dehydrogenase subunit G/effector-binding domain-containing protein
MRWFLGLLLVIALVGGALYGVGRFILPNSLEVTRNVSIERPRAAVFAMINDLRNAKEWSPYYARDPDAEFAISDQPGPGQTMRWVSNVREVGRGRMSIVDSTDYEQVEAILEMGDRATLNSRIELRPSSGSTSVAWTVTAECGAGWVNVPCRYMNLIMQGMIKRELDSGLARLKTLTEQLPNVNFEGLNPQFDAVAPQQFVYSTVETAANNLAEMKTAESIGISQVRDFMSRYNLTQAGPLVRVVTTYDQASNRMSFRVGYPFDGPTPTSVVGVQIGQTPSGEAMHVLVEGSSRQVQTAYAQMNAYMQAHRISMRENGLPWEVVHDPGPPDGTGTTRLEIFMPLQ